MHRAVSGCQLRTAARAHMTRPGRQKTRAADIGRGQGWTIWLAIPSGVGMTEITDGRRAGNCPPDAVARAVMSQFVTAAPLRTDFWTSWQISQRIGVARFRFPHHATKWRPKPNFLRYRMLLPTKPVAGLSDQPRWGRRHGCSSAGVRLGAVSESHSVNGRSAAVETHPLARTDVPPIVPANQTGKVTDQPHDSLA
jgi:hypothetical protein